MVPPYGSKRTAAHVAPAMRMRLYYAMRAIRPPGAAKGARRPDTDDVAAARITTHRPYIDARFAPYDANMPPGPTGISRQDVDAHVRISRRRAGMPHQHNAAANRSNTPYYLTANDTHADALPLKIVAALRAPDKHVCALQRSLSPALLQRSPAPATSAP